MLDQFPPYFGVRFVQPVHQDVPAALEPASQTLPQPFVACITGASRGIGRATAEAFAKAGATGLVLTARKAIDLEDTKKACLASAKSAHLKVSIISADAGSEGAAKLIFDTVKGDHGRLDILINNAGLVSTDASAFGAFDTIRPDQIRITADVNYIGRFLTMQTLLPVLLESPAGAKTIVNVTSIASHLVGRGSLGFNISELASNRLTESVATEYADRGVLCYSVHPGHISPTADAPPGMDPALAFGGKDALDLCGAFCLWLVQKKPEWLSGRYLSANWDVVELDKKREDIVQGDKLKARMAV